PEGGASASWCDAIEVHAPFPADYRDRTAWMIEIVLRWTPGTANNNMWLWVWAYNEETETWGELGQDRAAFSPANNYRPRRVVLGDPDPNFVITVQNAERVNSGYTLELIWHEIAIDLSAFSRPQVGGPAFGPVTPSNPQRPVFADGRDLDLAPVAPVAAPKTNLVPGPDGEVQQLTLPTIARGDRAAPARRSFDPVVALVVAALLGSGAVLAFVAIRRRQAEL
ncbi:MAG TPA: hypothetical protein VM840_11615, partial [Actinomycetota bacterium]|nr:hypothetical protein [Actinomycetota bacterium]